MAITRERCDSCHIPFEEGMTVYRYTMHGSAAEFDGVAGQQIFLHGSCARDAVATMKHGKHRDRMILAHDLALSIKEECQTEEAEDYLMTLRDHGVA